jgi:predicted enzyme related to lactoylglutathione lyase
MGYPVVHFEIGCRDGTKTQAFYAKLFDWTINQHGPAGMIATGGEGGINGHINSLGHEPHNYCAVYVQVPDLAAHIKKAQSLGGKQIVPPTDVPGMGQFAWIADPEGTIVGLWKPAQK